MIGDLLPLLSTLVDLTFVGLSLFSSDDAAGRLARFFASPANAAEVRNWAGRILRGEPAAGEPAEPRILRRLSRTCGMLSGSVAVCGKHLTVTFRTPRTQRYILFIGSDAMPEARGTEEVCAEHSPALPQRLCEDIWLLVKRG